MGAWGPQRNSQSTGKVQLLARERLKNLLSLAESALGAAYQGWIEEAVKTEASREPAWSESIVVGGKRFVERVKEELGFKAIGRKVHERLRSGMNALREPVIAYSHDFGMENGQLSGENGLFHDIYPEKSDS